MANGDDVQQNLIRDVAQARQFVEKSAKGAGVQAGEVPKQFEVKALRQGRITIGQKEIATASKKIDQTIRALINESGLADQRQRSIASNKLKRTFSAVQRQIMEKNFALRKQLREQDLSFEDQQAAINAYQSIVQNLTATIVTQVGRRIK